MKKYKLIKEYPGSPPLDTLAFKIGNGSIGLELPNGRNQTDSSSLGNIFDEQITNYPEFWQEIVEKDYEIINFHKGDNKIVSIKRLSDGEIFTIGDVVSLNNSWKLHNCKIKSFKLNTNSLDFLIEQCDYSDWYGECKNQSLNCWSIIKQPLFTTEDGVDIFEGDNCYFVRPNSLIKAEIFECNKEFWKGNLKYYKWFSTKEKAEEYILMNKPFLSLQEILEFRPTNLFYIKLKKKVQEKIKNN